MVRTCSHPPGGASLAVGPLDKTVDGAAPERAALPWPRPPSGPDTAGNCSIAPADNAEAACSEAGTPHNGPDTAGCGDTARAAIVGARRPWGRVQRDHEHASRRPRQAGERSNFGRPPPRSAAAPPKHISGSRPNRSTTRLAINQSRRTSGGPPARRRRRRARYVPEKGRYVNARTGKPGPREPQTARQTNRKWVVAPSASRHRRAAAALPPAGSGQGESVAVLSPPLGISWRKQPAM